MGKAVTAIVVIVLLGLAGLGYYAWGHPTDDTDTDSAAATSTPTFVVATTSPTTAVVTTTNTNTSVQTSNSSNSYTAPTPKPTTTTKPKPVQTASAYSAVSGYHSSYGLTVPGSYTVTQTRNVYGGVYDTATLNFYQGGVLAFTINVFSKEQWNDIRIQETMNADQGNANGTYFGEGSYLGENFTWIFSAIPGSYGFPAGVRFY